MSVANLSVRELAVFVGLLVKSNQKSFNQALEIVTQASSDNCLAYESTYHGESGYSADYDELEKEALAVLTDPVALLEPFGPIAYNMVANDGSQFGDVASVRNMETICQQFQDNLKRLDNQPTQPEPVADRPFPIAGFVRPDWRVRHDQNQQAAQQPAPNRTTPTNNRTSTKVSSVRDTIAATLEKAFPFSVDLQKLQGPDGQSTPHYGLFRSDNGSSVGNAFKASYTPHQTSDVIALAEAASDAFGTDCQIETAWNNGHFVTIAPTKDYRRQIFQPGDSSNSGDNVFPRLIIKAGYNGRAFTGTLGIFRDVCDNLQILRQIGGHSASIKHTTGLHGRMDDLRSTFLQVAAKWSEAADLMQALEAKPIDLAEFIANVYPLSDESSRATKTSSDKRVAAIVNRVINERRKAGRPSFGTDYQVTAFEAFQAINGYEIWDKPRRGNPSIMDRVVRSLDSKPSQRAESLAFELAGV